MSHKHFRSISRVLNTTSWGCPLETRKDLFFELRQYRIKSNQRERWVKFMEEKIIPFHVSRGIVVVGSFISPEKEDLYVWIRRFESEEERSRYAKEVAESDY